jgi:tetratricopeptide (TPR) repeat protein
LYKRGWFVACLGGLLLHAALGGTQRAQGQADAGQAHAPAPAPQPASAQADEQSATMSALDTEARQHFEFGRTFYDSGRFQQAAEEFEAAYKLSNRPQLLYNVYVAKRDAGELPKAIEALRAYLDKVPDAPDRVNLKARLESLEAQQQRQDAQEARIAEAQAAQQKQPAPQRTRIERKRSVVPYVLLGTGGALLLGSVATGVIALKGAKDLDDRCGGNNCPSTEEDKVNSTKTLAITTDVLWAVGGAAAVTGMVLFLTGALDSEREVPIAFGITPTSVSTHLRGRF